MHFAQAPFFILLAIVLFAVGLILVLVPGIDPKIISIMLFGGLTSFAVGHIPVT